MVIFKRKIVLTLTIVLLVLPVFGFWLWLRNYADKLIVDEAGLIEDSEPFLIDSYFLKKYFGAISYRFIFFKKIFWYKFSYCH